MVSGVGEAIHLIKVCWWVYIPFLYCCVWCVCCSNTQESTLCSHWACDYCCGEIMCRGGSAHPQPSEGRVNHEWTRRPGTDSLWVFAVVWSYEEGEGWLWGRVLLFWVKSKSFWFDSSHSHSQLSLSGVKTEMLPLKLDNTGDPLSLSREVFTSSVSRTADSKLSH